MTVTVKEGRYYIDGHGQKRGPMKVERAWFIDDRGWGFYQDGQRMAKSGEPGHPDHLVREWVEPADEGPVRTVTRREIVPGVYGRVLVTEADKGDAEQGYGGVCVEWCNRNGDPHSNNDRDPALMTAHELRSAAMVLSQLAEALDDA